jgi:hypothetical protein
MELYMHLARAGSAAALMALIAGIAQGGAPSGGRDGAKCATQRAALRTLLDTEYAFGEKALTSVRGAFLEYLDRDSWVLNPGLEPGRAWYEASKDRKDQLTWYPVMGDVAPSGDLGFANGPWVYRAADIGKQLYGHFLSVWVRDAECKWCVKIDGGISHAAPASAEPKLLADQAALTEAELPPQILVTRDAAGHAVGDFRDTAERDGLAAALRTYGRNQDFIFFTSAQFPISGVGPASAYLDAHALAGTWVEKARGRSNDSTLAYSVGVLTGRNEQTTHAYVEIWQYDSKVANWGLRVLLVTKNVPRAVDQGVGRSTN